MLFGSNALEVAAGLFFVYLLLSLLTSAVNEWFAGWFSLRAQTLRQGIAHLLDDPVIIGLAERFYQHPLIEKLGSPDGRRLPSYIEARTFATVLLDLLPSYDNTDDAQTSLGKYRQLRTTLANLDTRESPLAHVLLRLIESAGVTPIQAENSQVLLTQLEVAQAALAAAAPNVVDPVELKSLLEQTQTLAAAYQSLEREAGSALVRAQQGIEAYFDQTMERLTGVYRRRTQLFMLGIAVVITVLLNVDTFAFVAHLVGNDELRQALADRAAASVLDPTPKAGVITPTAPVTATWAGVTLTVPVGTKHALDLLNALNLPLGWEQPRPEGWGWATKLMGLLISAVAAAMGAPFWYDLLSRITNVRLAGRPPTSLVPTSPPAEP